MPPYLREWGVTLCTANKPAFDAFIDRTKKMFVTLNQAETATPKKDAAPAPADKSPLQQQIDALPGVAR